jgi:DNA-binding NarL/FixJ family response regulator
VGHHDAVISVLVWAPRAAVRARLEAIVAGAIGLCLAPRRAGVALGEAIDLARPEVALVDVEDEAAGRALAALRDRIGAAIVVLADTPGASLDDERSHRGPVRGVLPRDAGAAEIVAAIGAVAAGLVVRHPGVSLRRRAASLARGAAEPGAPLTPREIEVLAMVADGLGNKAVAAALGISAHTAKYHVASILAKLGAASRAEAVAIGLRRGLVVI